MASDPTKQHGTLPPEIRSAAASGWRLLPVRARGKAPTLKNWRELATTDLAQLVSWAVEFPGCNWGVATGAASDLLVIDVDGPEGRDSVADLERQGLILPRTLTVKTGREDGGIHLYYRLPNGADIRNDQGAKIGPHIDARATGGFVVCPPSVHATGRAYEWADPNVPIADAPPWLLEMLAAVPALRRDAIRVIPEGQRNRTLLSIAGGLRRRGLTAEAIKTELLETNQRLCSPPLEEDEVHRIATSIMKYAPQPKPDSRQPLLEFIRAAIDKNALNFACRSKWMSPLFTFVRLLKGRTELSGMTSFEAVERVEKELAELSPDDPWESLFEMTSDPRAEFIVDWDQAHSSTNEDALARAWTEAQQSPVTPPRKISKSYCLFLSLAAALQRTVGMNSSIALPQTRIGEMLGVEQTMVSRYIKIAERNGLLVRTKRCTPHQLAAEYVLDLAKLALPNHLVPSPTRGVELASHCESGRSTSSGSSGSTGKQVRGPHSGRKNGKKEIPTGGLGGEISSGKISPEALIEGQI
ncbi:MAG: bifunctional DNA primase/polymerase [Silvibacterium sp.]